MTAPLSRERMEFIQIHLQASTGLSTEDFLLYIAKHGIEEKEIYIHAMQLMEDFFAQEYENSDPALYPGEDPTQNQEGV
jgi:hypothetical protein